MLVGAVLVGAVSAVAFRVVASEPPPPGQPAWVGPAGTTNLDNAPEKMAVLDCKGRVIGERDFRKELQSGMDAPSRGSRVDGEGAYEPPCDEPLPSPIITKVEDAPPTDPDEIQRLRER